MTITPASLLASRVLELVYSFSNRHREAVNLLSRGSARAKPRPNLRIGDSPHVPKQPSDITQPDAISHVVLSFPIVAEPDHAAFDSSNKLPALMREAFAIPLFARKDAAPLAHGRTPVAHNISDFAGLPFSAGRVFLDKSERRFWSTLLATRPIDEVEALNRAPVAPDGRTLRCDAGW